MSEIRDCLKYAADVNPFWSDPDKINKEQKDGENIGAAHQEKKTLLAGERSQGKKWDLEEHIPCSSNFYTIKDRNYFTFWLVLTYDLLKDRCTDDIINIFCFFSTKDKKIPCCCSSLFSNRSQEILDCAKNIIIGLSPTCQLFVLITFWHHVWSITEQMYGNVWQHGTIDVLLPPQRRKEYCNSLIKRFKSKEKPDYDQNCYK